MRAAPLLTMRQEVKPRLIMGQEITQPTMTNRHTDFRDDLGESAGLYSRGTLHRVASRPRASPPQEDGCAYNYCDPPGPELPGARDLVCHRSFGDKLAHLARRYSDTHVRVLWKKVYVPACRRVVVDEIKGEGCEAITRNRVVRVCATAGCVEER